MSEAKRDKPHVASRSIIQEIPEGIGEKADSRLRVFESGLATVIILSRT